MIWSWQLNCDGISHSELFKDAFSHLLSDGHQKEDHSLFLQMCVQQRHVKAAPSPPPLAPTPHG